MPVVPEPIVLGEIVDEIVVEYGPVAERDRPHSRR